MQVTAVPTVTLIWLLFITHKDEKRHQHNGHRPLSPEYDDERGNHDDADDVAKKKSRRSRFQRPSSYVAPHTGQSSQLFLDVNDGNAQFLPTVAIALTLFESLLTGRLVLFSNTLSPPPLNRVFDPACAASKQGPQRKQSTTSN